VNAGVNAVTKRNVRPQLNQLSIDIQTVAVGVLYRESVRVHPGLEPSRPSLPPAAADGSSDYRQRRT